MRIQDADQVLTEVLEDQHSRREAENIRRIFWEDLFHQKGAIDRVLHSKEIEVFNEALEKLKLGLPIQYVTGVCYFYDLKFFVNEHVLIPRPETEELVELVLENMGQEGKIKILDVGCGSGCIPITIKHKRRNADVLSIDISPEAIEVARKNAERNEVRVKFKEMDFLDEKLWNNLDSFDIIVSNPPYIHPSEKAYMSASTLAYEPSIALFPEGEDALIFYRKLAEFGGIHLNSGGKILVECSEFSTHKVAQIFKEEGFSEVLLIKDLQNKERFVSALLS